jgi:cobyric acid synthase
VSYFLSGWTAYRTVQIAEHGAELWHYARGKEMGRAQIFQAEAAGITPDVRMNPVLLKPTSDRKAQVVLMGKVATDMDAVSYHEYKPRLREQILSVYNSLAQEFDVLVLEGAGARQRLTCAIAISSIWAWQKWRSALSFW